MKIAFANFALLLVATVCARPSTPKKAANPHGLRNLNPPGFFGGGHPGENGPPPVWEDPHHKTTPPPGYIPTPTRGPGDWKPPVDKPPPIPTGWGNRPWNEKSPPVQNPHPSPTAWGDGSGKGKAPTSSSPPHKGDGGHGKGWPGDAWNRTRVFPPGHGRNKTLGHGNKTHGHGGKGGGWDGGDKNTWKIKPAWH